MFAHETQQMEICLLKSDLEKIGSDLAAQQTDVKSLNAERQQQYHETMSVMQIMRSIKDEVENLKLENACLVAKRVHLKQQCTEVSESLCEARIQKDMLMYQLKAQDKEENLLIRQYEDSLRGKADRYRQARVFMNEEAMMSEIKKTSAYKTHLDNEMCRAESHTGLLRQQLQALHAAVPEDIVDILGKNILNETLKELTTNCEELEKKRDDLVSKGEKNSV